MDDVEGEQATELVQEGQTHHAASRDYDPDMAQLMKVLPANGVYVAHHSRAGIDENRIWRVVLGCL